MRRFVLAAALALAACHSSSSSTSGGVGDDAGVDDGGADAGDAGSGKCQDDTTCAAQKYCDVASGACVAAKACTNGQSDCEYQADTSNVDYCDSGACFCDPVDMACRPRHAFCAPCARDVECGNTPVVYDTPAACRMTGTVKRCLPLAPHCPRGFPNVVGDVCETADGQCLSSSACSKDTDCDPASGAPECDIARGTCVPGCDFDLRTGDSTGCAGSDVCHLDARLTDPSKPNYAKGKCAPPCSAATTCASGLACRAEGVQTPVMRCTLPAGECLGDVECPSGAAQHAVGYCDKPSHACKTDCRTDPDCVVGYGCQSGACVQVGCDKAGGALLSCACGELCCGEQNGYACPAGTMSGACYHAPDATWEADCMKDADCNMAPFRMNAHPNYCDTAAKKCRIGCDVAKTMNYTQCPSRWQCLPIFAGCMSDSDCNNVAGACLTPDMRYPDQKVCSCASGMAACPSGATLCATYLSTLHLCASTEACINLKTCGM